MTTGWFYAVSVDGQTERLAYRCNTCSITVIFADQNPFVWCCGEKKLPPTQRKGLRGLLDADLPRERFTAPRIMQLVPAEND
jgi:hypothetical protein